MAGTGVRGDTGLMHLGLHNEATRTPRYSSGRWLLRLAANQPGCPSRIRETSLQREPTNPCTKTTPTPAPKRPTGWPKSIRPRQRAYAALHPGHGGGRRHRAARMI